MSPSPTNALPRVRAFLVSAVATATLLVLTMFGAVACNGGGSGGSNGGGSGQTQQGVTGQATTVNDLQWQTALAALAQGPPPAPVFDAQGLATWTAILGRAWPPLEQSLIVPLLDAQLRQQLAAPLLSNVTVTRIRALTIDFGAPPAISSRGADEVMLELPAAPGAWRIQLELELAYVTSGLFGSSTPLTIAADATVAIEDIRIAAPVRFDLSVPGRPQPLSSGSPQVSVRIVTSSNTPLLQQFTGALTRALDPIIRGALVLGAGTIQQQLTGTLSQTSGSTWGAGGPSLAAPTTPTNLDTLAALISEEIQRDHTPFGTVVAAEFDQPGYGNGVPVRYAGYGDSAIWTGHYFMAEALRYDLTGDPRAEAAAAKVFAGLEGCVDVSPADGQLGRCIIPMHSPHISSIQGSFEFYTGVVGGQTYGSVGHISRDQYLGVFMASVEAYLRVPSLRNRAKVLIGRMVSYLERNNWIAFNSDGVTPALAIFAMTPHVMWAAIKAANLSDQPRWQQLHDSHVSLSKVMWFSMWTSNLDPIGSYYKYNLQHDAMTIMIASETDPARYRTYLQAIDVMRAGTGHHQNAWFDAVYGMAVPAVAAQMGPQVKAGLQHWALRDRRQKPVDLTNDPTIVKATFQQSASTATVPGQSGPPPTQIVAKYPIPIEKRPPTDFLWQRDPFSLKGGGRLTSQEPGVDLVLPYWLGRSYGLFR